MKQNESTLSEPEKMLPEERRAAFALALIFFLRMTGLFMITPVFALYAGQLAGATPTLIGVAIGIYGLTQALLQIPFGMASDRWGRKPVIALGLAIFVCGSALAALASSIFGVLAGRALQGAGAVGSATLALAADLTREEQRIKAMAVIGITIGLAFPVAFIAGPMISGWWGGAAVFFMAALLGIAGIGALYTLVPNPNRSMFHRECEYNPGQFKAIISDGRLLRLDYGVFSLHALMTATFVVTPIIMRDSLGMALQTHWHLYLPALVLSVLALGPLFRQAEARHRMREVFLLSIGVLLASQVGLYLVSDLFWGMGAMLALFFTAINFLEASQPSLISRLAPAAARGTAMGVYSTAQFLGIFFGGLAGGWLSGRYGPSAVYVFNATLALLWLIPTLSMPKLMSVRSRVVRVGPRSPGDADILAAKLRGLRGVTEAEVIGAEGIAYLKVFPEHLNNAELRALIDPSGQSASTVSTR